MKGPLDRTELLKQLDPIELDENPAQLQELRSLSLGASLLHLAGIDHEREYQLCAAVARHLLGRLPEPEDVDFSE